MKKITRVLVVATLILVFILILRSCSGCNGANNNGSSSNPDKIALSYAENILKSRLKNPESLQIHSSKIYVDFEWGDYHYYSITIDYSAQNGFGGYNRDNDYDVLVKVHKTTKKASEPTTSEYLDAITKYNESKS